MDSAVPPGKFGISPRTFLQGVAGVAVIYLGIFAYIGMNAEKTNDAMQSRLATEIIPITRPQEEIPIPVPMINPAPVFNEDGIMGPSIPIPTNAQAVTQEPVAAPPTTENDSLYPAPMDGVYEEAKTGGLLPKISDKGLTPFRAYQKPFVSPGKPLIALAVADFGLSESQSKMVLAELPAAVSLIISPYAADPEKWQQQARETGHEVWLQLPMETASYPTDDPGAQAILSQASLKYDQDRLNWVLSRTPGYAGIAAKTDDTFANNKSIPQAIFKEIFGRGLGFLELNTQDSSADVETMALAQKAPFARNQVFLDETSLKSIEATAIEKGSVVGIIRPTPNSIKGIKTWLDTLNTKGLAVAPVSALATTGQ